MGPRRVGRHVGGGQEPPEERVERIRKDAFREALSHWATGVSVLAVREGDTGDDAATGAIHALTVGAFIPVSIDPPLVLASLGANASALPYLETGTRFVVSILGGDQRGLASRYADTFPVGPSPFPESGPPRVAGSMASVVCEVTEMQPRGDHTLVFGAVVEARAEGGDTGLAYWRRSYHPLG